MLGPWLPWQTHAEDEAEIVRRASEHLRSAHDETTIRPNMVDQIKAQIRDADALGLRGALPASGARVAGEREATLDPAFLEVA